jgi:hypothetical protein
MGMVQWLPLHPRELFVEAIHWLVLQWDASVSAHEDHF